MKTRWLSLATLLAFLGLTVLQTFHGHENFQAESHCGFCELIHQAPALTNPPPAIHNDFVFVRVRAALAPFHPPRFVLSASGRSPPLL